MPNKEVNVLKLCKDGQSYVFLYEDDCIPELVRSFSKFARDRKLNFNWLDAAILAEEAKRQAQASIGLSDTRDTRHTRILTMWEKMPLDAKLLDLSGESTVAVELLAENADLIRLIKQGKSKAECLAWINENF